MLLVKGPGGFHRREKTLARIPIRLLWLFLPSDILHDTKAAHSDLSLKLWRFLTLLPLPAARLLLQTAGAYWYTWDSQCESEIAAVRTQANRPRVPGISRTTTTGLTCSSPYLAHPRPLCLCSLSSSHQGFHLPESKQAELFPPQGLCPGPVPRIFILYMGFSRQEYWSGLPIPFSSGPHFVRTLHHDWSVLGGPTWHSS